MVSSRITNQSGKMSEDQFQELPTEITAVINPVKPAAIFTRTPGQASI